MARIKILRVEFLASNGAAANAGDVLEVFADTASLVVPAHPLSFSGTGLEVEVNGVVDPGTNPYDYTWLGLNAEDVSIQDFNQQVCVGTSLVVFTGYPAIYPYAYYYSQENHYSCVVNPPTCNLIIVGIPTVTPSTDEVTADGSISVVAESSLTIQYKIGSDFIYGDGTAQVDGDFSGLLPGQYRIYVRDSANCQANILVQVVASNTFGTRFRFEFTDLNNNNIQLDLTKRGYVGTLEEVHGQVIDNPLELAMTLEGQEDKFKAIAALLGTLNLSSQSDGQFHELFTNDPNLYRMVFTIFGQVCWTGKVLKQQYSEPFKHHPYSVIIKATDGLSELKNFYLVQPDGQKYYGTISAIKLIAHCLSVTRIELDIRVAINLYATAMAQTDSDDPLDQAYIDVDRFYLATSEPTLDFVLASILESFGARIVQWENNWCITRVEEMCAAYDYRLFDKDGEYLTNDEYNPVKELGFPSQALDLKLIHADQNQEIRPSYGTLRTIYKLGLKPNVLRNGDFRLRSQYINLGAPGYIFSINKDGFILVNAGYSINEGYEQIDNNNVAYTTWSYILDAIQAGPSGGQAYFDSEAIDLVMGSNNTMKLNWRYKISSSSAYINILIPQYFKVNVPYTKFRTRVTFDDGINVYYLTNDGRWTTEENEITFFVTQTDEYLESEVIALQPPVGTNAGSFIVRTYLPFPYYAQFYDQSDLEDFETYNGADQTLPNGYRTELRVDTIVGPGTFSAIHYYELTETTDAASFPFIIEPNDYHVTNNPRKWVRKAVADLGDVAISNPKLTFTNAFDRVKVSYLVDGKDPDSEILRSVRGESGNPDLLEKELILGSYSSLITTEVNFGFDIGVFIGPSMGSLTARTTNVLMAYLLYTGYYRDVDGVGFEKWARDGISEQDQLHGIVLKMLAAQYKKSSRLLTGTFKANTGSFFGFLNVLKNMNDSNRILMPMGLVYNVKQCSYSGEMIELKNIFDPAESAFSSEFSRLEFTQQEFN